MARYDPKFASSLTNPNLCYKCHWAPQRQLSIERLHASMGSPNHYPPPSATYTSERSAANASDLRLLHFNDVYHVEAGSAEPVGGITRFQTVVNHYRSALPYRDRPKLITLFSGDAYNPSLESSVTKGRHMVPILNNIGTNVACVGVSMHAISFKRFLAHFKAC